MNKIELRPVKTDSLGRICLADVPSPWWWGRPQDRRLSGSRRNKHRRIARRPVMSDYDQKLRDAVGFFRRGGNELPPPNHAERAVDIREVFGDNPYAGPSLKAIKAKLAGARGRSAAPMETNKRIAAYKAQRPGAPLTTTQMRQAGRMGHRAHWRALNADG